MKALVINRTSKKNRRIGNNRIGRIGKEKERGA